MGTRYGNLVLITVLLACASVFHACSDSSSPVGPDDTTQVVRYYGFSVIHEYPHDPLAFTQGLVYHGGYLYEGTGINGRSALRLIEIETGTPLRSDTLDSQYFGEGITIYQDRIYQLTWQSQTGFVYDRETFTLLETFSYDTEGWGITHDGARLVMSDGSDTLRFLDPVTYVVLEAIAVQDSAGPVVRMNELEYIRGEIYANIWQTDRIAIISPQTGRVTGWIDLEGLLAPEDRPGAGVLNGIAYDGEGERLFVTGKLWPKLFEIELVPE
ncbi:MAG: glutaminyl-peptide cyclotransferase [bacterium]|nr:MAG: glutaminyl-peptide cyclotransferase [bacterium]